MDSVLAHWVVSVTDSLRQDPRAATWRTVREDPTLTKQRKLIEEPTPVRASSTDKQLLDLAKERREVDEPKFILLRTEALSPSFEKPP